MMVKIAPTDHPIHALISDRWSPYGFTDRKVAPEDLRSLFEAARWAPSCYNEQPWRFIVATSDDAPGFARLLSCLVDANQAWARHAPVLALGVARRTFTRNDRVNRHALYDLGQAVANLSVEATERGLAVHQMGGILPERARELYLVPDEFEIVTGIAIGHAGAGTDLPDDYRQRDATPRVRSSLESFVFADRWEVAAGMVVDD